MLTKKNFFLFSGLVPKSKGEMAQDREVLGQEYHHGGVRTLRGDGETLVAPARNHSEERQGKRVRRPLAAR